MRLVSALLFVALTGSLAVADEAKPADPQPEHVAPARRRVPLRVVRMLPETRQVLLFDKNRGTHVVAEAGQEIEGYIVDEIADDEVTLVAGNGAEIILTAPESSWRRHRKAEVPTAGPVGEPRSMAPIDPYADAEPAGPVASSTAPGGAPIASTTASPPTAAPTAVPATSAPVASTTAPVLSPSPAPASAPADPYANMNPGIAAFVEAVGAAPAAPAAAAPVATAPAGATAPASAASNKPDPKVDAASALAAAATGSPAPVAAAAPPAVPVVKAPAGVTITRADIDTALADFGATAVTFDAAFVAEGLRIDQIAKGTILGKLGLEKGDILTAVDNQPLHSLDDAANLYARAGTATAATLHVLRGGKPVTLKVTIR